MDTSESHEWAEGRSDPGGDSRDRKGKIETRRLINSRQLRLSFWASASGSCRNWPWAGRLRTSAPVYPSPRSAVPYPERVGLSPQWREAIASVSFVRCVRRLPANRVCGGGCGPCDNG